MSDFLRALGATAEPRGMHGFAAPAQVRASSDFGPVQTLRTEEYAALAHQLEGVVNTMKAVGQKWRILGGLSASSDTYDTSTTLGQIFTTLKKARIQVSKAESVEDEPDEATDAATACDNASKLLQRAKKMIAACIEDEDEETDEGQLEAAKSSARKVAARLAALKAKPAAVAVKADATGAVSTQAVAALDKQCDVLKTQLADVIDMIGRTSRSAGAPPNFAVVKAEGTNDNDTTSVNERIRNAQDLHLLSLPQVIEAKGLNNRLVAAQAANGSLDDVRAKLADASANVRDLFAGHV